MASYCAKYSTYCQFLEFLGSSNGSTKKWELGSVGIPSYPIITQNGPIVANCPPSFSQLWGTTGNQNNSPSISVVPLSSAHNWSKPCSASSPHPCPVRGALGSRSLGACCPDRAAGARVVTWFTLQGLQSLLNLLTSLQTKSVESTEEWKKRIPERCPDSCAIAKSARPQQRRAPNSVRISQIDSIYYRYIPDKTCLFLILPVRLTEPHLQQSHGRWWFLLLTMVCFRWTWSNCVDFCRQDHSNHVRAWTASE